MASSASSSDPSATLASSLSGENIAKMLRATGPIVSCVLLRCKRKDDSNNKNDDNDDDNDTKPAAKDASSPKASSTTDQQRRPILTHLIEQVSIDTTPKKNQVSQILGGPFTFLGQYEEEGTMVMVRVPPTVEDQEDDGEDEEENGEKDVPQRRGGLELNPHLLQPPLHNCVVYGDILLLKVAPCNDDDDDDDNDKEEEEETNQEKQETVLANEDFFLNYTKEEYIQFASRTDIVAQDPPSEDPEEDDEEGEEMDSDEQVTHDESDSDEEFQLTGSDDEMDDEDEDCQIGMMNLILAQIIKRFREEHGRGPDTLELLTMRSALAEKLGIQCDEESGDVVELSNGSEDINLQDVLEPNASTTTETEKSSKKRKSDSVTTEDAEARGDESKEEGSAEKRVKFSATNQIKILPIVEGEHSEEEEEEEEGEDNESAPEFQIIREGESGDDPNAIQDDEASI